MRTEKTTKQAFHDIPLLEKKLKTDEAFNFIVMDAIRTCVGKVASREHENQYQTYEYLEALGFEDEEIVFIYGIVCAQRAMEQVTSSRLRVSKVNVKN